MSVTTDFAAPSKGQVWTGRVVSGIAVVFLLFDAIIHLLKPQPVVTAFGQLGYPLSTSATIGVIELFCVVLYVIPGTAILGAILLTGYLGGAIAAQLRIGAPLFSTMLFPIYVAAFVWGGLYLRYPIVRTLIRAHR